MLVTMLGGCSLFGEPATPVVPDARTSSVPDVRTSSVPDTPTTGVTVTPEITKTPTSTPTPTPTKAVWVPKVTPTNTPEPTAEPTAEPTVEPTQEVQPTVEPVVTEEPTYTLVPTDTPVPTATDTPVPTATLTPTNTPKPTATNTPKPTATPKAYKLTVVDEYYRDGSTFLKSVTRTTAEVRQGAATSTYYALATSSRAYKSGESGVSGVAFMGVSVSSSGFSVSNHGGTSQKVTGTMPGNDVVITYSYRVTFKASVTQPPKATSTPTPTDLPPIPTQYEENPPVTQTPGTTTTPKPQNTQAPENTPEPEQRHVVSVLSYVEYNSKGEAIDCTETVWSDGSWEIVSVNRVTGYSACRGVDSNGMSYSYGDDGSHAEEQDDYDLVTDVQDGYTIVTKQYHDGTWELVSVTDPDGNDVTDQFRNP